MGMLNRVWLAAVFSVVVSAARAEDGRISFNLPAQPLAAALKTYAQQADIELIYGAELVAGKQSPALAGQYNAREALQRLLAGSGLRGDLTAEGTATITAEGTDPREQATDKAPRKSAEEGPTVLPEMTVTASPGQDTGYSVPNASTATKTNTPIFDTPVSIQVVPYQVIQDQKGYQIKNAVENVSGVRTNSFSGYADNFVIRGFNLNNIFRNGLALDFTTYDTVTAERIEVLTKVPRRSFTGASSREV